MPVAHFMRFVGATVHAWITPLEPSSQAREHSLETAAAHQQDLPSASPPSDVAAALGLPELRRKWYVQGSCASNGDGLFEGMDWLATTLNEPGKA